MYNHRFQDQNKTLADFYAEVWVVCPSCSKKAITKADYQQKNASLFCVSCGYNKRVETFSYIHAAHLYFNAKLWLQFPFKNDVFWAFNEEHLAYLASYIAAGLREHNDRTHFTLLEKLPKFYHEAKNREALLAIINKLKKSL